MYSVQTGKTAFAKEFGYNIFEYLSTRPADSAMVESTLAC